jgi:hypothetical protein
MYPMYPSFELGMVARHADTYSSMPVAVTRFAPSRKRYRASIRSGPATIPTTSFLKDFYKPAGQTAGFFFVPAALTKLAR